MVKFQVVDRGTKGGVSYLKKPLPSQFKKKKKNLIRSDKLKIFFISFQRSILSEDKQTFHWFNICLILFLHITEQEKPSVI